MKRHWPAALVACLFVFGSLPVRAADADKPAPAAAADDSGQPEHTGEADNNAAPAGPAPAGAPADRGAKGQSKTDTTGFDYDDVIERAKARAAKDYQLPPQIPGFLQKLDYAQLRRIHYQRDQALWYKDGLGFQAMFYHPGAYYRYAVNVNLVNDNRSTPLAFDKNRFDYPDAKLKARVPDDLGYAGFKLLHALEQPDKLDEVQSFLGATYFRGLGADEHYGLSARGLAIDTGSDSGEEFPLFTDFWLVEPNKNADTMTVYALLDSPSATGAYRFEITPGTTTVTRVEATLFTRKKIAKLGVAPLTSMFTWGENSLNRLESFRPEAHDSDGMLIAAANGEWLWRPLVNPQTLRIDQFSADNVRGFGLLQRDRDFDHYQALDYEYEKRPSAWVVPRGDWGKGHLELVEIPSDNEVNDNMVLYWVPKQPVVANQRLHFVYDIRWTSGPVAPDSFGHAEATRVGRAAVVPGQPRNAVRVVIEFTGGELGKLKDPAAVQPRVNAMRDATINNIEAVPNPHTGGWRLTFLVPDDTLKQGPLELRAYLAGADGGALTETWSYALTQ